MKLHETQKKAILRRVYQTATGRRDDKVWQEAWAHIRAHLGESPSGGKASHSVFLKEYRLEARVAALIAQAATGPSDSDFWFLTGPDGSPTGAPCLIFRRWFNRDIGEQNGAMLQTLWVVALQDGTLITAYPKAHPHSNQR